MLRVQLRFALTVNVGPAKASVAPISTWSAVGELRVVVGALIPSLTSALTVADAVLTVRHPPSLPEHCASAWLAPTAEPRTIAARRKRVAIISKTPGLTVSFNCKRWFGAVLLSSKTQSRTDLQRGIAR